MRQPDQLGGQLAWKFEDDRVRVISVDYLPLGVGDPPTTRDLITICDGEERVITYQPPSRAGLQTCHVRYADGRLWDLTVPEDPVLVWENGWVRHGFPGTDFGVTFGLRGQ